ncbi:MAG: histone deacetylase [Myxococcota bacterium]
MPRWWWLAAGFVSLAGLAWLFRAPASPRPRPATVLPGGAVVAYSPGYRVSFFGIERLHPFDIGKMDRIADHLVEEGLLGRADFGIPAPADDTALAEVHDPVYLASLHRTPVLARAIEVGVPDVFPASVVERRVRRPFRLAVGGTELAARGALAHGLGINLGGGYHHARPALGHGFCIYNDVAFAIGRLRASDFRGQVLIVDTDAHQGDGDHAFFADDPTVTSFSMHQGDLFPTPKLRGDRDIALPAGTDDARFLGRLESELAELLAATNPALVIHVAGSDVLHDDPLAGLGLSVEGLIRRDLTVLRAARERDIAVLYLLAGGYGPSAAKAQARSVAAMLREVRGPATGP